MTADQPRFSASDALLEAALAYARERLQLDTQLIKLRDLSFRACEGFYSKSAEACTWPCSITQMDPTDPVSYTHLDVYKRQVQVQSRLLEKPPHYSTNGNNEPAQS